MIARWDKQSRFPIADDFWNAARGRGDDWLRTRHRIQEGRAEPFGHRTHDEQIEALEAAENVGAESWQQHVLLEVVLLHLPLELFAELTFTQDDETCVGNLLHDQMRRFDQMTLSFMRNQRSDVADHGRLVRKPEGFVHVDWRGSRHVLDVDSLVHGYGSIVRHAVGEQNPSNRFGRRDEAVDLTMLPARQRIAFEMKVDAPRRDDGGNLAFLR